ncbi:MAG TPA: XTP/dITP diphosphatase [Thermodesulfobacteriota bacterium]|mgnify:CR=1 FL=1|nr:XTP/dITP diphosphatase [Thermodesulfobacteriota bacterium]
MIDEIVLATGNKGKIKEFEGLLRGVAGKITGLGDLESPPEIVEDGDTFMENALKKARALAKYSGKPALADDSGLAVDALGGKPGVYSARYAGEGATDEKNIDKLLGELGDTENRNARFVCFLALVTPDGKETVVSGKCKGIILTERRGSGGFGYDPVFYLPEFGKTMAEIPSGLKNEISHRARAVEKLVRILKEESSGV